MNRLRLMVTGAVVVVILGACGSADSADNDVDLHISAKPVPSDPCALLGVDAFAQVMPNPVEIPSTPSPQKEGYNLAACRIDAGAGEARGSLLVLLVTRFGDSAGRSGTDWAKDITTRNCADIENKLSPTGSDLPAEVLAGLGDQSCGVQDPGTSQRIVDYRLHVRRDRDVVSLDVTRAAGDANTPKQLAALSRAVFDKLP